MTPISVMLSAVYLSTCIASEGQPVGDRSGTEDPGQPDRDQVSISHSVVSANISREISSLSCQKHVR